MQYFQLHQIIICTLMSRRLIISLQLIELIYNKYINPNSLLNHLFI